VINGNVTVDRLTLNVNSFPGNGVGVTNGMHINNQVSRAYDQNLGGFQLRPTFSAIRALISFRTRAAGMALSAWKRIVPLLMS